MNTSIQATLIDHPATPPILPERKRKGGARKPKSGVYVRSGNRVSSKRTVEPVIEPDHYEVESYTPAPITLAKTTTSEITDEMVGLPYDPAAQDAAVAYLTMARAFRSRQAEKAAREAPRPIRKPIEVRLARPAEMRGGKTERVADIVEGLLPVEPDRRLEGMPI